MLSLSADITQSDIDLRMINGDDTAAAGDIKHGRALLTFAEAFTVRDEAALATARAALLAEAGPAVLVDAAAVAANFQRMVRIADATGIPLDARTAALSYGLANDLDLWRFASAKNLPASGTDRIAQSMMASPMARYMVKKNAEQEPGR